MAGAPLNPRNPKRNTDYYNLHGSACDLLCPLHLGLLATKRIRPPGNAAECLVLFQHTIWNTHPKPLPTGYEGIPLMSGLGDCLGRALGVFVTLENDVLGVAPTLSSDLRRSAYLSNAVAAFRASES